MASSLKKSFGPNIDPIRYSRRAVVGGLLGILSFGMSMVALSTDSFLLILVNVALTIAAVLLGLLGRKEIDESDGMIVGRGYATAGMILAAAGVLLGYVALPVSLMVMDKTNLARSASKLVTIGKAMQRSSLDNRSGTYPPAAILSKEGRPLLSWRVLLLPFLEEDALYDRFKRDEPWDSPHNKGLLSLMPDVYAPVGNARCEPYSTFYQVIVGNGAAYEANQPASSTAPGDGATNTLLVVEAGEAVPWTKPADLAFDINQPLPPLGGMFKPSVRVLGLGGRADGFHALFADAKGIRFISRKVSEETIRALITRNGGETIKPQDLE